MIVQGPGGRYGYDPGEKEALLRMALTAQGTPWVSVFRVGAVSADSARIGWFPCSLLVSASDECELVALEYRRWPGTVPGFASYPARKRWRQFVLNGQPGVWVSTCPDDADTPPLVRDSPGHGFPQVRSFFPPTSGVAALDAARAIRRFWHTGRLPPNVDWSVDQPRPAVQVG